MLLVIATADPETILALACFQGKGVSYLYSLTAPPPPEKKPKFILRQFTTSKTKQASKLLVLSTTHSMKK